MTNYNNLVPMNYRFRSLSLALLVFLSLISAAQDKKDIVVTIGDQQISKEEFEANYKKNNTNKAPTACTKCHPRKEK